MTEIRDTDNFALRNGTSYRVGKFLADIQNGEYHLVGRDLFPK